MHLAQKLENQRATEITWQGLRNAPQTIFSDFLKIYSGEQGKNIRQRYTALPLQYEIPGYLVHENKWDSNEPFTVLEIWNPDRDLYFRYKFSEVINDYVDAEDSHLDIANYDRKNKYPMRVTMLENGDAEVIFGLEYEIDIYLFKRANGCWYLVRVGNPRD